MTGAGQTRAVWAHPLMLLAWALVVAAATAVMVFERLPLPSDVPPLQAMTLSQGAAPGEPVSLPDNWRSHPLRPDLPAVYRTEFTDGDGQGQAVYIPSYSGRLAVAINGVELIEGGFVGAGLSADQGVPFFAPVSPSLLDPGGNSLTITLTPGGKLVGFLSPVYVGPRQLLRGSYNWFYLRAIGLPVLVLCWQALLAGLLFLLWYNRRQERAALYGALMMICAAVHGVPVFLPDSAVLSNAATLLGYVTNFWLTVIGLLLVHTLLGRRLPVDARWLAVPPAVATLAFFTLPRGVFGVVELIVVVPFSLVLTGWILFILVQATVRDRRWEAALLLISVAGAASLAVHDTLVIANVLPTSNIMHFRIAYILILPALSAIFLQRLIDSMNQVDTLIGTLESRIEKKEMQLRETFEQRRALESRQALNEERQRIMRDVHDGLGGQLISIIALATSVSTRSEAIEESARAALEDLRTMINSLEVEDDITGVLGGFRERAEQQLAPHGIALDWRMIDLPPIEGLTPSIALNVIRILQEAVTNVARHSGADRITIRFSLIADGPQRLRIDIEDNGDGIAGTPAGGRGLNNMAERATAIGGQLEMRGTGSGTRVSLTIPTRFAP